MSTWRLIQNGNRFRAEMVLTPKVAANGAQVPGIVRSPEFLSAEELQRWQFDGRGTDAMRAVEAQQQLQVDRINQAIAAQQAALPPTATTTVPMSTPGVMQVPALPTPEQQGANLWAAIQAQRLAAAQRARMLRTPVQADASQQAAPVAASPGIKKLAIVSAVVAAVAVLIALRK